MQGVSAVVSTHELEHFVGLIFLIMAGSVLSQDPSYGKSCLRRPRSMKVLKDRYGTLTLSEM